MNTKICEMITKRILEEMEKGYIPWAKPWTGSRAYISHTTGKPYSFCNEMLLGMFCGKPGEYITFNQAKAEGGKVKKGAHGVPVVFWKQTMIKDIDLETGEEIETRIPVLRYYTVFHISDCDGIRAKYDDPSENTHIEPLAEAETIVESYRQRESLKIVRDQKGDRAFYSPSRDFIQVPTMEQFAKTEEYYSTLFHEMTHSTGHASRLNRFVGKAANAAFGSEEYSREELIAEIGAAALVNSCGIETESSLRNSAAYIQGWSKALRADPALFITAAGKAEKAVAYILSGEKPALQ